LFFRGLAQVILATAHGFACVEDLAGAVLGRYDLGISKSIEMNTHDLPSQARVFKALPYLIVLVLSTHNNSIYA